MTVPDAPSLDLTNSMTLEAWVPPATLAGAWRTVAPHEAAGESRLRPVRGPARRRRRSARCPSGSPEVPRRRRPPLNTWSHLASTYDGEIVRLYVNGIQVATQAAVGDMPNSTGALRIGGNNIWSEWFDGQIDEVRVYGRALTGAEIQADMNRAVVNPDTGPPTPPSNLAAIGSVSSVALAWSGSSDDVGVVRYNVHRSTTQGFTPSAANRVGQPTTTAFADSPLSAGTYYYRVTAEDGAGNISAASGEASAVVTGDTSPPTALRAHRERLAQLGRAGLDGAAPTTWASSATTFTARTVNGFTPSVANRIAQPAGTSLTDTGLAAGTYYYRVTAEDAAGNLTPRATRRRTSDGRHDRSDDAGQPHGHAAGSGTATLGWTASTDNVGVARYNVHRSTTPGFTPSVGNRIAQPTGTSYADSGSRRAPTTTASPRRTPRGTSSAASAQATAVVSAPPPASSPRTASTPGAAPRWRTPPGTAITEPSPNGRGRPRAASAGRCSSTGRAPG